MQQVAEQVLLLYFTIVFQKLQHLFALPGKLVWAVMFSGNSLPMLLEEKKGLIYSVVLVSLIV